MINEAVIRAKMPEGTSGVIDNRSLENDYPTLIPLLRKGMKVLDVGCGTGIISKGIAREVGHKGYVTGIDSSDHLIAKGKENFKNIDNLELIEVDLFNYFPEEKFDLIVSARVLQWLNNPEEALLKLKTLLKPNGQISILDYNHKTLEWKPDPPESMKRFYQAFLDWRSDAGMDNEIAEHLAGYLKAAGFHSIETTTANETCQKGSPDFYAKVGIWGKVVETIGGQMVNSGYLSEKYRRQVIEEYDEWVKNSAQCMIMKLKEIRGKK